MSNRTTNRILLALAVGAAAIAPASAQYYVNPYSQPYYNDYAYRGYVPYGAYGYHRSHTVRNVAIGAGVGAAVGAVVGLLASHHGHNYW